MMGTQAIGVRGVLDWSGSMLLRRVLDRAFHCAPTSQVRPCLQVCLSVLLSLFAVCLSGATHTAWGVC